jgi:hypothetical protein
MGSVIGIFVPGKIEIGERNKKRLDRWWINYILRQKVEKLTICLPREGNTE